MNAKKEFLTSTESHKVICSKIVFSYNWDSSTEFNLKPGYTSEEYQEFLNNLDFNYDNGYGIQHLFGTIWCENGVWFERYEYDGSECWQYHKYPEIPTEWGEAKVVLERMEEADYWDGDESDKSLQ